MRPFFCNAPIFRSAPMHYKKNVDTFWCYAQQGIAFFCSAPAHYEKHITKICGAQHKPYVNFRWEIVFNNFLNLIKNLEFLGDTEL